MAILIDSTIGGELSNSYVDVAYCDEYWEKHFSTVKAAQWQALGDEQKELLLIQACQIIDMARFTEPQSSLANQYQLVYDDATKSMRSVFVGGGGVTRYYYYQALQFPRTDTQGGYSIEGKLFIPERIKTAQCEQALYLLNFDESEIAASLKGVRSENVNLGGIAVSQQFSQGGIPYSPIAKAFVTPFILRHNSKLARA